MLIALTRPVSPSLARCELTHLAREPIDVVRAAAQHEAYERLLRSLGATVERIAAAPDLPDAVFVEDTAVVLDEIAVVTRPGAPSRREETAAVAAALDPYRTVHTMRAPATMDGGDVLRLQRTLYVGRSGRTNDAGIEQLRAFAGPLGYRVMPVEFSGCLHLKSAATAIGPDRVLIHEAWVPPDAFAGCDVVRVDPAEPYAANALCVGNAVVFPEEFPRTCERLRRLRLSVETVECSELAKAEGAVTCCSLLFDAQL